MGRTSDARDRLMTAIMELIWAGSYGGTTVDAVCARAGVRKGSFYYFFESKLALVLAALEREWMREREFWQGLADASVHPVERIRRFSQAILDQQREALLKFGRVLGCPLYSLGAEVSTQERGLPDRIEFFLGEIRGVFEAVARDLDRLRIVSVPDPESRSRVMLAYSEGLLTQARIQNRLECLADLEPGLLEILGLGVRVKLRGAREEGVEVGQDSSSSSMNPTPVLQNFID